MPDLPTGTVTLLFTDIEGSTRMLRELGDRYADVLAEHRRILRETFRGHGGIEVDTQGDAFFYAFAEATAAVEAAAMAQLALADGPVRVRIGVHTGEPIVTAEGYVGIDVHRAARIMGAGHGGQVLVSERTRAALEASNNLLLADLGLHRLKDLGEPEKVYQLGEGDFPPLRALDATNLPVAASPLLGRERELQELLFLLRDGTRLLTVTGTGGTGKTRLALQAAAELVGSYKDGVFWVALAGLGEPELVLPTIAQTLGARGELSEHLRGQELLLLLDNAEHLLAAAPALGELLDQVKGLQLLVTSRAPLHLSGERDYPLEPLLENDAVTLFCERARAVGRELGPDETSAAICRRLDGLPLAIELAAARTKLLAPETLLERLEYALPLLTGGARDAPERQRTLRATIDWSYDLLDEGAKRLFARLAVFAGSFSLEAAEEVCEADLDGLAALVDPGLLKPIGESLFLMLEVIREYAAERLAASEDANDLGRQHAGFFSRLVEQVQPYLSQADAIAALAEDEDNLRAALDFYAGGREPELMLRLAGSLWLYWAARDQYAEGRRWLEEAVREGGQGSSLVRAQALRGLAMHAMPFRDYRTARALTEEALAMYRELGDDDGVARCLNNLGRIAADQDDLERATALYEESLAVGKRLAGRGSFPSSAVPLDNLARLAMQRGDYREARRRSEEALTAAREEDDDLSASAALNTLAWLAAFEGRFDDAAQLAGEFRAIHRSPGRDEDFLLIASMVLASRGHLFAAARLVGAAGVQREELGLPPWRLGTAFAQPFLKLERDLGEERFAAAWEEGAALSRKQALAVAERALD